MKKVNKKDYSYIFVFSFSYEFKIHSCDYFLFDI